MFEYDSDSPQVKRNLISTVTNLEYELPHELLNGLRPTILGNQEMLEKCRVGANSLKRIFYVKSLAFSLTR